MADKQLFTNNASALLRTALGPSDTSLNVMIGYGNLYPQPSAANEYFLITLEDESATQREIIRVNGRVGDTFTNIVRAQEGTVARNWPAGPTADTLVDHRITAATMRLAMELPEQPIVPPAGIPGITTQTAGTPLPGLIDTLNFTGPGVSVSTSGTTANITISGGGSGSAWIYGANAGPIAVATGATVPVSAAVYSTFNRTFKFLVTILNPNTQTAESFELMALVNGDVSSTTETVTFTRYGRTGTKHQGGAAVSLDTSTNTLSLTWHNLEAQTVQVMVTRIQHQP